jgi:(E)-4-hydroxy-3-methylbut-2-enyl-diphosphate synthase
LVQQASKTLKPLQEKSNNKRLKVAIMGCVVNGPGEARDADLGIAWGGKSGILFKKGKKIRTLHKKELLKTLIAEVKNEMV